MKQKQIMNILSREVRGILEKEPLQFEKLQEIRLRVGHPVIVFYQGKEIIKPKEIPVQKPD